MWVFCVRVWLTDGAKSLRSQITQCKCASQANVIGVIKWFSPSWNTFISRYCCWFEWFVCSVDHTRGGAHSQVISLNQRIYLFSVVWKPIYFCWTWRALWWTGGVEAAALGAEMIWFWSFSMFSLCSCCGDKGENCGYGRGPCLKWAVKQVHVLVEQFRRASGFSQLHRIEMDAGTVPATYLPLPLTIVKKGSFAPRTPAEIRELKH